MNLQCNQTQVREAPQEVFFFCIFLSVILTCFKASLRQGCVNSLTARGAPTRTHSHTHTRTHTHTHTHTHAHTHSLSLSLSLSLSFFLSPIYFKASSLS